MDKTTARLILISCSVVLGSLAGATYFGDEYRSSFGGLFCISACVSFLAMIINLATDARRYLKRELIPRLVRALAPLRPNPAEILDAVRYARSLDLRIGKRINPDKLFELIQRQLPRQPSLN